MPTESRQNSNCNSSQSLHFDCKLNIFQRLSFRLPLQFISALTCKVTLLQSVLMLTFSPLSALQCYLSLNLLSVTIIQRTNLVFQLEWDFRQRSQHSQNFYFYMFFTLVTPTATKEFWVLTCCLLSSCSAELSLRSNFNHSYFLSRFFCICLASLPVPSLALGFFTSVSLWLHQIEALNLCSLSLHNNHHN